MQLIATDATGKSIEALDFIIAKLAKVIFALNVVHKLLRDITKEDI
jgi:hypothetical protein